MSEPKPKCIFKNRGEDDVEALTPPCFGIGPDVQLKDVPTNGEEYLLKVINERQHCSIVTKCTKDYSKFAKNQSCFIKELPHAKAPDKLKPTIEWQNIQVADFSDTRMYISRLLENKSVWPSDIEKFDIDKDSFNEWKRYFSEHEPTLTCVMGMPHVHLDIGLESLIQILGEVKRGETIDHKTGQWIYAFLACTRQPLLSETTSILRDLARKCADIRSHINPDDENALNLVTPLNIFICLVSRYFRQYDLADVPTSLEEES